MATRTDRAKQTVALIALLKTLPDGQLLDVLTGVDATPNHPAPVDGPRHRGKPCITCGLIYPKHIAHAGYDGHPFEVKQ